MIRVRLQTQKLQKNFFGLKKIIWSVKATLEVVPEITKIVYI